MTILNSNDGVVIVDHGSRVKRSNQDLLQIVQLFRQTTNHRNVQAAHMELAVPSIADAVDCCVASGAERIIVVPHFLGPGRHWHSDIPRLAAAACKRHLNLTFLICDPLGIHQGIVDVMIDRVSQKLANLDK